MRSEKRSPMRGAGVSMNTVEAISLAAGLAIALALFLTVGIDREIERKEAAEQWFYCNYKKEC